MLSLTQLDNICLLGGGSAECRYLSEDDDQPDVYHCLKRCRALKQAIDEMVTDAIHEAHKHGHGLDDTATGDNCHGYPVLQYLEQGHDIPELP